MTPKHSTYVSIIVPVFNSERFLNDCLNSILGQSFKDFEVILVNDGSRDGSGDVCDAFARADSRIRVVHTKNQGVSAARNTGLRLAQGDWIAFVDSDDTVEEAYLDSLLAGSYSGIVKSTSILVVAGMAQRTLGKCIEEHLVRWEPGVFSKSSIPCEYLARALYRRGQPFSKLFNAEVIRRHNLEFDQNLSYGEDLIFLLEYLVLVDNLVFVGAVDYNYLIRPGAGLSAKYFSFPIEYRLFERFVRLNQNLLNSIAEDDGLMRKKAYFLWRAISCLYRPPHRMRRSQRISILSGLASDNGALLDLFPFGGGLLRRSLVSRFDLFYNCFYLVRYSCGRALSGFLKRFLKRPMLR